MRCERPLRARQKAPASGWAAPEAGTRAGGEGPEPGDRGPAPPSPASGQRRGYLGTGGGGGLSSAALCCDREGSLVLTAVGLAGC